MILPCIVFGMATSPTDLRVSAMVREAAGRLGLTHQALASIAGIHRVALIDRLQGRTKWTLSELTALARALDLDLHALLDSEHEHDWDYRHNTSRGYVLPAHEECIDCGATRMPPEPVYITPDGRHLEPVTDVSLIEDGSAS